VSRVIDEPKQQYSMTWSAKRVHVKGGASHFTIYNRTSETAAKLDVKYRTRSVPYSFSNFKDLLSILKQVFFWTLGDSEDPLARSKTSLKSGQFHTRDIVYDWMNAKYRREHRGIHIRFIAGPDNFKSTWRLYFDTSALNSNVTAFIIENMYVDKTLMRVTFTDHGEHKFETLDELQNILDAKLYSTPLKRQIIWNSIFRLTSLLEHVSTVEFEHISNGQ
jgi:hypothetical protein